MSRRPMLKPTAASPAPPRPANTRWYVHIDEQTYGPFTGDEIQQMTTNGQVIENDLVYPETAGKEWVRVKDEPTLQLLLNHRLDSSLRQRRGSSSHRGRRVTTYFIAASVLIVAWIAWPYYATYRLTEAFRKGDVAVLESGVAWDAVRAGLKSDINAMFIRDLGAEASQKNGEPGSALGTGLAAVLAPAIVNQLVDGYVTPQAIATSSPNSSTKTLANNSDGSTQNNFEQKIQSARNVGWKQVEYMFFSGDPFTFKIEIRPERDPPVKGPVTLILNWAGNWKLTRILLPTGAIADSDSRSATGTLAGQEEKADSQISEIGTKTSSITSAKESPLQISLVEKGFKAHDYRASDYEDNITFVLQIKNITAKDIRAFDGVLTFTDLLDNKIYSSKLAINEPINAGSTLTWYGMIKYNQFNDEQQRLRTEAQANLKLVFGARKVLFSDGNTKVYDSP